MTMVKRNYLKAGDIYPKKIKDYTDNIYLHVKGEPLTHNNLESIINIFNKILFKLSIYKNRRGRYKGVYLWCKANLGTCRVEPMFRTTYNYELVDIQNIKIIVEEEKGAF